MANYLFLLLVLACPLMMVFMMRGMHGGHGDKAEGGHAHGHAGGCHDSRASLGELRERRDELDREIAEQEAEEETPTPVGGGWR